MSDYKRLYGKWIGAEKMSSWRSRELRLVQEKLDRCEQFLGYLLEEGTATQIRDDIETFLQEEFEDASD